MARLRVGDDVALAAIYDRYGGLVEGIATRLVGANEGGDVTQDVFLRLWQRPERYDPERGALSTYLAVATRHRAIDMIRRRQRRAARERRAVDSVADPVGRTASVDTLALASVEAGRIRDAVARLPEGQRRAIELAYFGGLSYREVAVEMASTEGTAKSRLRLGLRHLAADLAADPHDRHESRWN